MNLRIKTLLLLLNMIVLPFYGAGVDMEINFRNWFQKINFEDGMIRGQNGIVIDYSMPLVGTTLGKSGIMRIYALLGPNFLQPGNISFFSAQGRVKYTFDRDNKVIASSAENSFCTFSYQRNDLAGRQCFTAMIVKCAKTKSGPVTASISISLEKKRGDEEKLRLVINNSVKGVMSFEQIREVCPATGKKEDGVVMVLGKGKCYAFTVKEQHDSRVYLYSLYDNSLRKIMEKHFRLIGDDYKLLKVEKNNICEKYEYYNDAATNDKLLGKLKQIQIDGVGMRSYEYFSDGVIKQTSTSRSE